MIPKRATRAMTRGLAGLTVLPILALGAACGGTAAPASEDSASVGDAAGSATTGARAEMTVHDADSLLPAMKTAMGERASARVHMEMTGAAEMSMDGRMTLTGTAEDVRADLTMEFEGEHLEMRVVGGLIYLKGEALTDDGKWIRVDPADDSDPLAASFEGLMSDATLSATFEAFEAGMTGAKHLGEDKIGGEAVQHYEIEVDTAEAAEAKGESLPRGMPRTLTYEVWLTAGDLMRRVSFEMPGSAMTMDATEWGEPVEVEAPPASEVAKAPQV